MCVGSRHKAAPYVSPLTILLYDQWCVWKDLDNLRAWSLCFSDLFSVARSLFFSKLVSEAWFLCFSNLVSDALPLCFSRLFSEAWFLCFPDLVSDAQICVLLKVALWVNDFWRALKGLTRTIAEKFCSAAVSPEAAEAISIEEMRVRPNTFDFANVEFCIDVVGWCKWCTSSFWIAMWISRSRS